MANNCKQCFNAHYQPHCHTTTNSLWLCSSVHCGPPHQSRRIWLSAEAELSLIFQNFQNSRHFEVATNFLPKAIPEFEYSNKIAMNISNILSFWSTLLKYWWRSSNFKIWPTLRPVDVIDDAMNTNLYEYSHNPMTPMYRKFNGDISVGFLVIMKMFLFHL